MSQTEKNGPFPNECRDIYLNIGQEDMFDLPLRG